jgi:hypothetical protein
VEADASGEGRTVTTPGFAATAQKTAQISFRGEGNTEWSATLRGESETEEYWDRLSEEWLAKVEGDEREMLVWLERQDSRPEERVSRPMPPVPALRTRFEESVIVPV